MIVRANAYAQDTPELRNDNGPFAAPFTAQKAPLMAIQWFPGHMHLTRKAIAQRIKEIDVVIEVLDARLPGSSANPLLAELTGHKPTLKILNKQDMADPARTALWLAFYNAVANTRAVALQASDAGCAASLIAACHTLAPGRAGMVKPMRVLICGVPNVGKSTLINTLSNKRQAKTGDEAGITKLEQRITLADDFYLYDTPGLLWPRIVVAQSGLNLAASDEHMLSVTAPAGLRASTAAVITVDNGNGTGASTLDRSISIATGHSGDPLGLGVGWAAAFGPLMTRPINAATDSRLARRVVCDGKTDDRGAVQGALVLVQRNGGGVVNLPAGICMLRGSLQMLSGTVLQGAGKDRTELRSGVDSAIYTDRSDLIGVRALTLTSTINGAGSSLNLKNSTRVAIQSVRVNEGARAMAWMYGNTNLVITDSEFLQTGSLDAPGAVHASSNAGLVFTRNTVSFLNNTGTDQGNRWIRDASRQADPGVVHTVAINFAHRIALVGNEFTTINGPVDPAKNDGETILTEGGGPRRTEGLGRITSATANTVFDPTGLPNPNAFINGALPENYGVAIVSGRGAGQTRRVTSFAAGRISVARAWDVLPDSSSRYATAVWGLEKALIKGNNLTYNTRGIWLYSTAVETR